MISEILKYSLKFILLVLVQVLILNNIQYSGFINPYAYILFLLILPVRIPKSLLLIIAFFTGLTVDMFGNSIGLHASACLLLAYARPMVLRILAPRDGYETDTVPSIIGQGFKWFMIYTALLTVIHHLLLFYLESFRLSEFFTTFVRALSSSLATITVIILFQYLFFNQFEVKK